MHPAILLDISTSKASGSTLNSHVYLKKLTLTEQDLALNSTPLIYDSILYLFHKIHIFRAGFVLANQLLTWGLYLVWPGEQPSLSTLCLRLAVKIQPNPHGCGWTKLLARGLCAWSNFTVYMWLERAEHCSLELKGSQMSLGAWSKLAQKRNHRLFILHSSQTIVSDGGGGHWVKQ